MEKQIVVMFPAQIKPEEVIERMKELTQFVNSVLSRVPGAFVVPLLNGPNMDVLSDCNKEFAKIDCIGFSVNNRYGLNGVLKDGYKTLCNVHPEAVIVRMDDKEHPVDQIRVLIDKALVEQAMIVGDLVFERGEIEPGSGEDVINNWIFPDLYSAATRRKDLGLSCAHGFQVFPSSEMCLKIVNIASQIILEAAKRAETPVTWGWDGAMVMAAAHLEKTVVRTGIKVVRVPIPAVETRKRDPEKIHDQFRNHLNNCLAAERLFSEGSKFEIIIRLGI